MINFDNILIKNIKKHNPNWAQIRDHLYKILIWICKNKFIIQFNKSAARY